MPPEVKRYRGGPPGLIAAAPVSVWRVARPEVLDDVGHLGNVTFWALFVASPLTSASS